MARAFAKWAGVVFLVLGILGFFTDSLFGLLHFDTVHNVIHLAIGIWGLLAGGSEAASLLFAKIGGIAYLALGSLGFFVPDYFGMMKLSLSDNVFHLIVGAAATYIGFVITSLVPGAAPKSA